MKVEGMTKEEVKEALSKGMKVRAIGETTKYVGYYNNFRRRGGDVFMLWPKIRVKKVPVLNPKTGKPEVFYDEKFRINRNVMKEEKIIITAEKQFSSAWMERVPDSTPVNRPAHFNKAGEGDARRLNIPGMTQRTEPDRLAPASDEVPIQDILNDNINPESVSQGVL